jgi:hypothetical protein
MSTGCVRDSAEHWGFGVRLHPRRVARLAMWGVEESGQLAEAEYLDRLSKSSENIKKAFQDQQARAIVSECWLRPRFICDLLFCARGHGTKRNSSKSSWNGSSHVTSLSKRLKGLSSSR